MTILYKIGVVLASFVGALFVYGWYEQLYYRYRTWRTPGTKLTFEFNSFPLGIPNLWRFARAFGRDELHDFMLTMSLDMFNLRYRNGDVHKTMRAQTVGSYVLMTIDPENVKAVLATQFKDFDLGVRYNHFWPMLGDGVFTLSGSGWSHTRALLRPQFTHEQVSRLDDVEVHVQSLIDLCRTQSSIGFFDIQELFFKLTLDTSSEFLLGESTYALTEGRGGTRSKEAVEFGDAFNEGQEALFYRSMAQKLYFFINTPAHYRAYKTCRTFVDHYVNKALAEYRMTDEKASKEGEQKYVFLKELCKETQDPVLIRDQVLNIMVAGRDTTASLLSFTFALLAQHKDKLHKLREAILADFGTTAENINFTTLKRCDYLKWTINEVLRLYPIVAVNFRMANKDTTLPRGGGADDQSPIFVQKGTVVMYHPYTMQRNPLYWGPDADQFIPERWQDIRPTSWTYIPFNGGPRICLGQQLALTDASYAIVRLLQNFKDVTLDPSFTRIKARSTLTIRVADGVPVHLTPA